MHIAASWLCMICKNPRSFTDDFVSYFQVCASQGTSESLAMCLTLLSNPLIPCADSVRIVLSDLHLAITLTMILQLGFIHALEKPYCVMLCLHHMHAMDFPLPFSGGRNIWLIGSEGLHLVI